MRAFLEKHGTEWLDDFVYISNMPLQNLGVKVIPFDGTFLNDFIEKTSFKKDDILIGSVEATIAFFKANNIVVPNYIGYPSPIEKYLGRKIIKDTLKNVINHPFPWFVKPANDVKKFTGSLVENNTQLDILHKFMGVKYEDEIYYSDVIPNILSEYRCFIHKGELKGIQWYLGDFTKFPDVNIINNMIKDYKDAPVSYTLDVAVTDDSTILIEVNDMWAIGSYGLGGRIYVRMCIDRFQEIINKK